MIDSLTETIAQHWSVFGRTGACDQTQLSFTKFCQRIVQPHTKVLFYVSYKRKPLCILKTVRSPEWNKHLEREMAAQSCAPVVGNVRAPRVYFSAVVDGRYVYAEEAIDGLPISQTAYARRAGELAAFVDALPKQGVILSSAFAAMLNEHVPVGFCASEIELLAASQAELRTGLSHGDLGRPNVLAKGGALVVIDWERAGDIPIAGIDCVQLGEPVSNELAAIRRIYAMLYKKHAKEYRVLVADFHYAL